MLRKILFVLWGSLGLTGCSSNSIEQQSFPDGPYRYEQNSYYSPINSAEVYPEKKSLEVPENYLVGPSHAPKSHNDLDKGWVDNQNAQHYTIELKQGDKAADVAKTLQQAPKNERTAEVKYQQEGKTIYKGLYGSYPNQEAAEQALKALPEELKSQANVKTWRSVQEQP